MSFPCDTCICLAMCKGKASHLIEVHEDPTIRLYEMYSECELLYTYVFDCENINSIYANFMVRARKLDKINHFYFLHYIGELKI